MESTRDRIRAANTNIDGDDQAMSENKKAEEKKGGGLATKAAIGLVLVGAGGGGVFALQQADIIGGGKAIAEDTTPKLVLKGQADPFAPPPGKDEAAGAVEVEGDGGNKYRTTYFSFSDDFTSNLQGSSGLVQLSLAASTHRDGRVLMWLKKHELAVRSAILIVLADTPEEEVLNPEGKKRLQRRIADAINNVLIEAEGFGGVENVYFRNFLVQ